MAEQRDYQSDPREQLEALKESIEHWRTNANCKEFLEVSISGHNCALCRLNVMRQHSCRHCPVYKNSGKALCAGTPYEWAQDAYRIAREAEGRCQRPAEDCDESHYEKLREEFEKKTKGFRDFAEMELMYLEGLLPEAEKRVREKAYHEAKQAL